MTPGTLDQFQRWMDAEIAKAFSLPITVGAPERALTAGMIEACYREMRAAPPHIVYSTGVLTPTGERLFPESRHRSKRVQKKLIKRFGGIYRMKPAILEFDRVVYAHPIYRAAIEQAEARR